MKEQIVWLKSIQNSDGGIAGVVERDSKSASYPEVSGYLIPSLLAWGEQEFAGQLADYLVNVQSANGGYKGLRTDDEQVFDTAAVFWGLRYATQFKKNQKWDTAKINALSYCYDCLDGGLLRVSHKENRKEIYTVLSSALCGFDIPITAIPTQTFYAKADRLHYLAYAVEGLAQYDSKVGRFTPLIKDLLEKSKQFIMPVGSFAPGLYKYTTRSLDSENIADVCATLQFGILFYLYGYKDFATKLFGTVQQYVNSDGSVSLTPQEKLSWTAKYYLDLEYVLEHGRHWWV